VSGMPQKPSRLIWLIRVTIFPLAVLALYLFASSPGGRVLSLYVRGLSRGCSFQQVVNTAVAEQKEASTRSSPDIRIVRKDGHFELWDTPLGRFWIPAGNEDGLRDNIAEQVADVYSLKRRLRPGGVVLDAGANVGTVTRGALNHGASTVVAIEPAPENLECLRRNFASELSNGKVVIYPKGVWNKEELLHLGVLPGLSEADSFVLHPELSGPTLPVTTIDKLVNELALQRVDYVKLDIEGAEQRALSGASETIKRFHPNLEITGHHLANDYTEIPKIVLSISPGYRSSCVSCIAFMHATGTELRQNVIEFF
jgi:FkbM family methyltransferase